MIKLTKPQSDGLIYVNSDEIVRFQDGHYGHHPTVVKMKDGAFIECLERADEINKMVQKDRQHGIDVAEMLKKLDIFEKRLEFALQALEKEGSKQ